MRYRLFVILSALIGLFFIFNSEQTASAQCNANDGLEQIDPIYYLITDPKNIKKYIYPVKHMSFEIKSISYCEFDSGYNKSHKIIISHNFYYSNGAYRESPHSLTTIKYPLFSTAVLIYDGKPDSPVWHYFPQVKTANFDPNTWIVQHYTLQQLDQIIGKPLAHISYEMDMSDYASEMNVLITFELTFPGNYAQFRQSYKIAGSGNVMHRACWIYQRTVHQHFDAVPAFGPEYDKPRNTTITYQYWVDKKTHYILKFASHDDYNHTEGYHITFIKLYHTLPQSFFHLPPGVKIHSFTGFQSPAIPAGCKLVGKYPSSLSGHIEK